MVVIDKMNKDTDNTPSEYEPSYHEVEGGDNSFGGTTGEHDDLQLINVAAKELPQPFLPFYKFLNKLFKK